MAVRFRVFSTRAHLAVGALAALLAGTIQSLVLADEMDEIQADLR